MSTSPQSYKAELVGVFGYPVAENPTVVMQEAGFRALGLNWRYLTIEVRPEQLADAVRGLRAMNFAGINLTIPHKVAVIQHLDGLSPEAELIGAVNTVVREGDRLIGHNTDGKGFLRSVREDAGVDPRGKRVVFLGAGGAARAMSVELALAGAAHITIVNRTASRGQELVALLNERTQAMAEFVPWQGAYTVPAEADILVNATPIGLFPDVEAMPAVDMASIRPGLLVCDVIPNPPRTAFLRAAEARGARTLDGLGMLVYQGAIAFQMWTGVEAPIDVMRKALEEAFAG
ncbi:MAG: shikimate dehydrogenase [Anaerolineae bacterium]|nr:shikimate dehydrogenase [Anaerolineae bacterium]